MIKLRSIPLRREQVTPSIWAQDAVNFRLGRNSIPFQALGVI